MSSKCLLYRVGAPAPPPESGHLSGLCVPRSRLAARRGGVVRGAMRGTRRRCAGDRREAAIRQGAHHCSAGYVSGRWLPSARDVSDHASCHRRNGPAGGSELEQGAQGRCQGYLQTPNDACRAEGPFKSLHGNSGVLSTPLLENYRWDVWRPQTRGGPVAAEPLPPSLRPGCAHRPAAAEAVALGGAWSRSPRAACCRGADTVEASRFARRRGRRGGQGASWSRPSAATRGAREGRCRDRPPPQPPL